LKVMTFARDVCRDFDLVRETNTGDLTKRRVRLLRGHGFNLQANALFMRATLHRRMLGFAELLNSGLSNQLINRWHSIKPKQEFLLHR
jgi:hypothetical protein